jgi:hypothetical protein
MLDSLHATDRISTYHFRAARAGTGSAVSTGALPRLTACLGSRTEAVLTTPGVLDMPRRLRIEFEHAVYQVMARGNARQKIVRDDSDRRRLTDGSEQGVVRYGWQERRAPRQPPVPPLRKGGKGTGTRRKRGKGTWTRGVTNRTLSLARFSAAVDHCGSFNGPRRASV